VLLTPPGRLADDLADDRADDLADDLADNRADPKFTPSPASTSPRTLVSEFCLDCRRSANRESRALGGCEPLADVLPGCLEGVLTAEAGIEGRLPPASAPTSCDVVK